MGINGLKVEFFHLEIIPQFSRLDAHSILTAENPPYLMNLGLEGPLVLKK